MTTTIIDYNIATGEISGARSITEPVTKIIRRIRKKTDNLRGLWSILADDFYETNEALIFSQRGGNSPFPDLADSTLEIKARRIGDPYPILVGETGDLRQALTNRRSRLASLQMGARSMQIGEKTGYGGFHQRGTKNMPARPPINITNKARQQRWADMAGKWAISRMIVV